MDSSTLEKLMKEIHPSSKELFLSLISSPGSKKILFWRCENSHEWESRLDHRVTGSQCPYCSGRKPIVGVNDLGTSHPQLVKEWHPVKNIISFTEVSYGSSKKVWWQCQFNHEWEASIKNRTRRGDGCPYCNKGKVWTGYNDLATLNPELSKTWDDDLNIALPQEINPYSKKKYFWKCELGHSWEAPVLNRHSLGNGCPYCSGRKPIIGVNDIASTHPEVLEQWSHSKNISVSPKEISAGSSIPVWWQCEKGHDFRMTPYNKLQRNQQCVFCSKRISRGENSLIEMIKTFTLDEVLISTRKIISPKELDIYIPEKKVAIEFNGLYWHSEQQGKNKTYHYDKWKACQDKGIQLIQIWEDDWNRNPNLVKRMLLRKLGCSEEPKIGARATTVVPLTLASVAGFLNENHIQGVAKGTYYFGLKKKNSEEIVAVMVCSKIGGSLRIDRFASSQIVQGGFSKLLKHVESIASWEEIYTFSDNTVSDGKLYSDAGFVMAKSLLPDYSYIVNGVREHKFGYRLKRFRNDDSLIFVENATEKQLAELNGLPRIWDAGKIKWVKI